MTGNNNLNKVKNPLSLTPTDPGRGSAETDINNTAWTPINTNIEYSLNPNER